MTQAQTESQASQVDHADQPQGVKQVDTDAEHWVPVNESIRYRKRAQAAEREVENLRQTMKGLEEQITQTHQAMSILERRQAIDALLTDSDAIDLHAARLLTEAAVCAMDEPDIQLAIDDIKRHKPYLFAHKTSAWASPMSEHVEHVPSETAQAAQRAVETGNRRDLLRYLRLRRKR